MNEPSTPLDRYHDRGMAPEEAARFEEELARSSALQAELALQRDVDRELRARFAPVASTGAPGTAGRASARPRHRALPVAALAAALLVASFFLWRALAPSSPASPAPPPQGCATWRAWVERAASPTVVACTTQPVDLGAPQGPVSVDGTLFLPMGWHAEELEAPIAPGVTVFRITARDGRVGLLLTASAAELLPVLADEPELSVAHRFVAGRACAELALAGPPFVLGALSGGL